MKKIQKLDDITAADWEDIKRRREEGATLDQIADAYGIARNTLRRRAERAGVDMSLPSAATNTKAARIAEISDPEWAGWRMVLQMREDGASWAAICREVGVCVSTLRGIMKRLGLRTVAGTRRSSNGNGGGAKVVYAQSLCWSCANAVPDKSGKRGCAWSRSFKPIKGWDAQETRLYGGDSSKRFQISYCVRQCPEFVRG